MNIVKKVFVLVLLTAIVLFGLTGCGHYGEHPHGEHPSGSEHPK